MTVVFARYRVYLLVLVKIVFKVVLNLYIHIRSRNKKSLETRLKKKFKDQIMQIQVLAIKVFVSDIQWNLFITDTKGTGISVRITEVSVLEK